MLKRFTAFTLLSLFLLTPLIFSNFIVGAQSPPQASQTQTPQTQPPAKDPNDPIEKIKDEGMNRSQVMQIMSYLTDVIGQRLTGSPNMKWANEWTRDKMKEWGLENSHLEPWGPFGRGWTLKRFSAQIVEPQSIMLIAYPKAWSPDFDKTLTADVVYFDVKDEADFEKYRGKLKGAIVLMSPLRDVKALFEPPGNRMTEKDLLKLADASEYEGGRRNFQRSPEDRARMMLLAKKHVFATEEGAALLVEPSFRGDGGTVFVQGATVPGPYVENPFAPDAPQRVQPWESNAPKILPQIVVAVEHYNRMVRMVEQGQKLKMSVNLSVQFQDQDPMAYNTIAEIPGTDLKDQVVMLGAHMDSWHAGTGATDNGAGVAVVMEAVRILQALKLQPRRTIRVGLWTGEEQGLLGSRNYVKEHLGMIGDGSMAALRAARASGGPPPPLTTKPDYEKFSVYFNLDNGTGKIRGIYLQGNEAAGPLFRRWLKPFGEMGASTLTISGTGGTDHQSFDGIGLPGFQFIQDQIEYETRTHHSNQDVYDRILPDDMKSNATIMAVFAYNAAMMNEKIPRKPMAGR